MNAEKHFAFVSFNITYDSEYILQILNPFHAFFLICRVVYGTITKVMKKYSYNTWPNINHTYHSVF